MAIFHRHHHHHHQPSNGPIRAKHITQCSSVIGQYDKVSGGVIRVSQIRPYLRHVHWKCVHRVCSWTLCGEPSLRWGSLLNIEKFTSFNSTCVLPNIWTEQSVCTSFNKFFILKFFQTCPKADIRMAYKGRDFLRCAQIWIFLTVLPSFWRK